MAIIFGSGVPFVLRGRDGESWCLVGESYVQGMMKGEVIEELNRGRVKGETILLR